MIASLRGELEEILLMPDSTAQVIVSVQGVGYRVIVMKNSLEAIGQVGSNIYLRIYSHIRESAIMLYGFLSPRERSFFESLLAANGVGPSLAMAILSAGDVTDLISAIVNSDIDFLTKVPGVGKKTAQRLVVELSERLGKSVNFPLAANYGTGQGSYDNFGFNGLPPLSKETALVGEALKSLGYGNEEIKNAILVLSQLSKEELDTLSTEAMLRLALRSLAKTR